MPVEVELTRVAEIQRKKLSGHVLRAYGSWLNRLRQDGCGALDYRMTGHTVERLCVRHLHGAWRVIVAFPSPRRAAIVLIGQHLDRVPELDVYRQLYELAGITTPSSAQRGKPPCCGSDDAAPEWAAELDDLVQRAHEVAGSRRRQ